MILKPLAHSPLIWTFLILLALVALVHWRASAREAAAEEAYPPTGQMIEVDGARIHLNITGQGHEIVMIHGASGSLRDFTFQLADRLKDNYRVIAIDRPGLGWSERPLGYGGMFNTAAEPPVLQARLLQAASEAVGVERPIVLGHSYGGAIALAWALERPDRTAGLVLVAAASNPWEGDLGWLYRVNSSLIGSTVLIPMITAFAPRTAVERTVRQIFSPQSVPDGYVAHFGTEMALRRSALRANAQQVNALKPYVTTMAERYAALDVPVESVHGTQDDTVPLETHAEPLQRQLPDATLTVLEGAGHMPHHTHIDAVLAAIERVTARAGLR